MLFSLPRVFVVMVFALVSCGMAVPTPIDLDGRIKLLEQKINAQTVHLLDGSIDVDTCTKYPAKASSDCAQLRDFICPTCEKNIPRMCAGGTDTSQRKECIPLCCVGLGF